jgi:hypothetical protein
MAQRLCLRLSHITPIWQLLRKKKLLRCLDALRTRNSESRVIARARENKKPQRKECLL